MWYSIGECTRVNKCTFTRDDIYTEICNLKMSKIINPGVYDNFISKYGLAGYSYSESDGLEEVYVRTKHIRMINESGLVKVNDIGTLSFRTISLIEDFVKGRITVDKLLEETLISKVTKDEEDIYSYLMTKSDYDKEFRVAVRHFVENANRFVYSDAEVLINKVCRLKYLYTIGDCISKSKKYADLDDSVKNDIVESIKHINHMILMLNASVTNKNMKRCYLEAIPCTESIKKYINNAIYIKPIGETSKELLKYYLENIIKGCTNINSILLHVDGHLVAYYKESKDESSNICNSNLTNLRDSIVALRDSCDHAINTIDNSESGFDKKMKNAMGRLGNSVRNLHKIILQNHSKF